jgi:hypothetical protein
MYLTPFRAVETFAALKINIMQDVDIGRTNVSAEYEYFVPDSLHLKIKFIYQEIIRLLSQLEITEWWNSSQVTSGISIISYTISTSTPFLIQTTDQKARRELAKVKQFYFIGLRSFYFLRCCFPFPKMVFKMGFNIVG